jgi:hypothetical protein
LLLRNHDALLPLLRARGRRLARRIADDDPVEPVGMLLRQAERGRAAHGQAGEMRLLDRERVHQGDHVGQQQLEAVAPGGRVGTAVPTLVVA